MISVVGFSTAVRAVGGRNGRKGFPKGRPLAYWGFFSDTKCCGSEKALIGYGFFVRKSRGREAAEWWETLQLATTRPSVFFHGTTAAQVVVQIVVLPIVNGLVGEIAAGGFQLRRRVASCLVVVEVSINSFV